MSIKTKLKHIKWINIINFNIYTVICVHVALLTVGKVAF